MFGAIAGFNNGPYDLTFGMADTAGYGWFVAVDPQTLLPEDLTEVNGDPLESYSESDVRNVYHDQQTDSRIQYLAIELCASMHLTKGLHAYAGGGYARQTIQYKFFDPTKKRGQVGDYWIDSDSHPDSFNAMGGLEYLFAINLYLLAGVESYPHTVNAGFGYWW
jgi:opacity protein-like surface antigen